MRLIFRQQKGCYVLTALRLPLGALAHVERGFLCRRSESAGQGHAVEEITAANNRPIEKEIVNATACHS